MFKKISLIVSSVLLVTLLNAQSLSSLGKGKKIIRTTQTQFSSKTETMGQTIEQKMTMAISSEITIVDILDKEIKIEEKATRLKMKMDVMGQEMEYDSDKTNNSEEFNKVKDFLNKPTFITTDYFGVVKEFNYDLSIENIQAIVGAGFNEHYNIGQPIDFVLVLPKDPAIGKSWTISYNLDSVKSDYVYTIKSIDNGIAKVEFIANTSEKIETIGTEMTIKSTVTTIGTLLVDAKTNLVKTATTKTSSKGTMSVMEQSVPKEMEVIKEDIFE